MRNEATLWLAKYMEDHGISTEKKVAGHGDSDLLPQSGLQLLSKLIGNAGIFPVGQLGLRNLVSHAELVDTSYRVTTTDQ